MKKRQPKNSIELQWTLLLPKVRKTTRRVLNYDPTSGILFMDVVFVGIIPLLIPAQAQNRVCVPKSPLSLFNCVVCSKCLFYSFMSKRAPSAVLDGWMVCVSVRLSISTTIWLPLFKWLLKSQARISPTPISAKCKLFVDYFKEEM